MWRTLPCHVQNSDSLGLSGCGNVSPVRKLRFSESDESENKAFSPAK